MVPENALRAIAAVVAGGISEMHVGQFPVQDHGFGLFLLPGRIAAQNSFRSNLLSSFSGLLKGQVGDGPDGDLSLAAILVMVALEV